jgi:DNA-binding Lrp family transcriptional regulator
MVRAYILIETTPDRDGAIRDSVGHGLGNCLALGHSFRPAEVMVHIECTDLESLQQAITQDLARKEGVRRITTLLIVKDGE